MNGLKHPATAIAVLALFVALGGTTYAAMSLPRNSVGAKQLKKNAVTSSKIKNRAVTAAKINTAGLTVPNALHATSADSATSATHAASADGATNATTAANANALGGVGASHYVQDGGPIYVQLGHANWEPIFTTDNIQIERQTSAQVLIAPSTGVHLFRIDGVMPTSLYGDALAFSSIQICYDATQGASITEVAVETDKEDTGSNLETGSGLTLIADDKAVRTDAACRTYGPSSPVILTSDTQIDIVVLANWSTIGAPLYLGRATAVLQPTATAATTPKANRVGGETPRRH